MSRTWFSVGMIGLAGAAILYDTSRMLTSSGMTRTLVRRSSCSRLLP